MKQTVRNVESRCGSEELTAGRDMGGLAGNSVGRVWGAAGYHSDGCVMSALTGRGRAGPWEEVLVAVVSYGSSW